MTVARWMGTLLALTGITMGTVVDRDPEREIPRAGEEFVLAADLHVHAFIGDGGLAPWEIGREARRRGLDVIVVSNHNQMVAARMAANLARRRGGLPIVIAGQEVTSPHFHMVAAGIREPVDWKLSASDTVRAIHAQGGIAIAAHPGRNSWRVQDDAAMPLLDGAEVVHAGALRTPRGRRELMEFFSRLGAARVSPAPIGSSDFHFGGVLGICRTYLFVNEVSERGVLDAIREGRTVAYGGGDWIVGSPERVSIIQTILSHHPPLTSDRSATIASWICLAGLVTLMLFR